MSYHPKAIELYNKIAVMDRKNGDCLNLTSGGDGDNGEYLLFYLSTIFKNLRCPHCKSKELGKAECACTQCGKTSIYDF